MHFYAFYLLLITKRSTCSYVEQISDKHSLSFKEIGQNFMNLLWKINNLSLKIWAKTKEGHFGHVKHSGFNTSIFGSLKKRNQNKNNVSLIVMVIAHPRFLAGPFYIQSHNDASVLDI